MDGQNHSWHPILTNEFRKMSNEKLLPATGGKDDKVGINEGSVRTVYGLESVRLALRSDPCHDDRNEIGRVNSRFI